MGRRLQCAHRPLQARIHTISPGRNVKTVAMPWFLVGIFLHLKFEYVACSWSMDISKPNMCPWTNDIIILLQKWTRQLKLEVTVTNMHDLVSSTTCIFWAKRLDIYDWMMLDGYVSGTVPESQNPIAARLLSLSKQKTATSCQKRGQPLSQSKRDGNCCNFPKQKLSFGQWPTKGWKGNNQPRAGMATAFLVDEFPLTAG